MPKARENAGDQVVFGFSFVPDWSRKWHEFSGPMTERSEAKPMQSRIHSRNHLKLLYQVTAIAGVSDTISHLSLSKRER